MDIMVYVGLRLANCAVYENGEKPIYLSMVMA